MAFYSDDILNRINAAGATPPAPAEEQAGLLPSFLRGLGRGASFGFYEPKVGQGKSSFLPDIAGDITGSALTALPLMALGGAGVAGLAGRLGGAGARFLPAIARGAEELPVAERAAAAAKSFLRPSAFLHPYKTAGEELSRLGGAAAGAGAGLGETLLQEAGNRSRTGESPSDPIFELSRGAALGGLGGAFLGKSGRMAKALGELKPPVSPLDELGPPAANKTEELLQTIGGLHAQEMKINKDILGMQQADAVVNASKIRAARRALKDLRGSRTTLETELAGLGGPPRAEVPEAPGMVPAAEPAVEPPAQGELPLTGRAELTPGRFGLPQVPWEQTPLGKYGATGQAGLSGIEQAIGQTSDRGVDQALAQLGNKVTPAEPEQARQLLTQGLEAGGARSMGPGVPGGGAFSPGNLVGNMSPEAVAKAIQDMSTIGPLAKSTLTEPEARSQLIALLDPILRGAAPGVTAEQLIQNIPPEQIVKLVRDFGIGGMTNENTARAALARVLGGALPPPPFEGVVKSSSPVDWGSKLGNIFPGYKVDEPEQLSRAVDAIQAGKGGNVPVDTAVQARVAGDAVFPDMRMPCSELCDESVQQTRLAASAIGPRDFLKSQNEWVRKAASIFPVGWVLRGSGADGSVELWYKIEGFANQVVQDLRQRAAGVLSLSKPETVTLQKLYAEYAKQDPALFDRAVAQALPQHIDKIAEYRRLQDRIFQVYVADGTISPSKRILNYHPSYREKLQAVADGTMRIEKGEGFYPMPIENMIRAHVPWSARDRNWTDPAEWARMDFKTQFEIQAHQFARHLATRQFRGDLEEKLALAEPELKSYLGDYFNYMLGNRTADQRVGAINKGIRDFQFVRTIGANVMSPITYTFQRLNTFALTSPKAFLQAFADMRDPARLQLMQDAGWSRILTSGDEAAQMAAGTGPGSGILHNLSRVSGKWFSASMRDNQIHAFMAGLRDGEAKGIVGNDLLKYAEQIMVDTQFIHSQANLPSIYRGSFGRIMGQFQQFRMNQTEFMTRLLTQAAQGDVKPLLKFWGPVVLLGGMSGLPFGDFLEDHATRFAFGRAMHIPGIAEALFGVSLGHQLGIGTIGMDDLGSWLYYLPGPSWSFLQQLAAGTTGYNFGSGADLSGFGEELRPSQRYRSFLNIAPMGVEANRIAQVLRLYQNDGEFRDAMDFSSFLGLTPPQGALLADRAATLQEQVLQGTGFRLKFREDERNRLQFEQQLRRDTMRTSMRVQDYIMAGDAASAQREADRWSKRWGGKVPISQLIPGENELRQAAIRRLVPPGARMRMPKELGGLEGSYWNPKPNIEWWNLGGTS